MHHPRFLSCVLGSYVSQDFEFFGHLTVLETMNFAVRLKLPASVPQADRLKRAEVLLKEMDLWGSRNTKIGSSVAGADQAAGISGGERKRLSIGVLSINHPYMHLTVTAEFNTQQNFDCS